MPRRPDPLEGVWQGYDGEWVHVSKQLVALAEAIPADKYSWRIGPGVRSTSEVFMHIAMANFYLLSVTGPKRSNVNIRSTRSLPREASWSAAVLCRFPIAPQAQARSATQSSGLRGWRNNS